MTTIKLYGVTNESNERKAELKNMIESFEFGTDNISAKARVSKKGTLKGFEIYEVGHKSLKGYVDLLQKRVLYIERKKIVKEVKF